MTRLVLIRHAEPAVTNDIAPAQWLLTAQGRSDATLLGQRLTAAFTGYPVWASPEIKAGQTAALAFPSTVARVREQLREVDRPRYADPDDLANALKAYLEGKATDGWERREEALARLALLEADAAGLRCLVVVSHGLLITTWLQHHLDLDDPFSFWSGLRTPDAWEFDPEERSLRRLA